MSTIRLRVRVSTETIEAGVNAMSKVAQTVMGINAIRSGFHVKQSLERQYKINNTITQVRNVTEIGTGLAKACAGLFR